MSELRKVPVAVAWSGLPWYAARQIRGGIDNLGVEVVVMGTRPEVPMQGMEELLGQPITWLQKEVDNRWSDFGLQPPQLFVHTGWNIRCFNLLAEEVRRSGGAVVSMIDNNYKATLRQHVGALAFRLWYRRRFSAVWVPGLSGRRFLRFLGMPDSLIYEGLYGSDPRVFELGPVHAERPKEVLFVGRMVRKKGVDALVRGFSESGLAGQGWTLRLVGDGPERPACEGRPGVICTGFLSEAEIGAAMRRARIFVLPSYEDHWGVVLAEAALSGCILIASRAAGAGSDLVATENGLQVRPGDARDISAQLILAAGWPAEVSLAARLESRKRGENFGPRRWGAELRRIVNRFAPEVVVPQQR